MVQSYEHDDVGLSLLGYEDRLPGIQHVVELVEDDLQYNAAVVGSGGKGLEITDLPDVGLHVEHRMNPLDHNIKFLDLHLPHQHCMHPLDHDKEIRHVL